MSINPPNPHKKGEHVFNDLAGSIENSVEAALGLDRAKSMLLTGPYGPVSKGELPFTFGWLTVIRLDPVLISGRTLVAPPSGKQDDQNSILYGRAKVQFEDALCDTVDAVASLAWKRRPQRKSSFLELSPISNRIISGIKDVDASIIQARMALARMFESACDNEAEVALLAERSSTVELDRRRAVISATKAHLPNIRNTGDTMITSFAEELAKVVDKRIDQTG